MNVDIIQTCNTIDPVEHVCTEYSYVGRLDNIQLSIPMLEAMGLITLWIVVCVLVATLIKRFS